MGREEIDYLMNGFYSGAEDHKRWQLSIFDGFLKFNGNGIVSGLRIGWPKNRRIRANWLEPEDAMLLRREAEGIEKVIVHLELYLLMRRVEVLRLTPESFRGNVVDILGKGRNGGKWRTVRIHRDTKEIVGWWQMERRRMVANADGSDPRGLLIWQRGDTLSEYHRSGIDAILRRLRERMETLYDRPFDFSNHTLRRTGGRMMWKAGVPLETIMEMLGHEDTAQTIKYLGLNLDD